MEIVGKLMRLSYDAGEKISRPVRLKNITSLLMRNAPGKWRDDFHQAIKQGRHYERAWKSEPERRFRFLTNSYRYVFVFALQRCHWLSPRGCWKFSIPIRAGARNRESVPGVPPDSFAVPLSGFWV